MAVSLFTSRVVLSTLGVNDYGICNVVGGFVAMFSILTNSMSRSISRYLTFELGKGNNERLEKIFATSINIQLAFSIGLCLLIETVGIWFLKNRMVLPADRLYAAMWVLQCSMVSMVLNLMSVPYNAAIVAHERMGAFAYISILEAVLKLGIVYLLYISPLDKLITYSILCVCVSGIIRMIYAIYCKKHFSECRYKVVIDKPLLKEMSSFAGWSFMDNATYTLNNQGINVLMNLFFGVSVNAARGIAVTVDGAVRQFVAGFLTAINPQIVKSYASGNLEYMHKLVCMGAKISCYVVFLFGIPICIETHAILHLWLGFVPDYSVLFVRLSIILALSMLVGDTLGIAVSATGKMKEYQLWNSLFATMAFPITYICYKMGMPVSVSYVICIFMSVIVLFVRSHIVSKLISMPKLMYNCGVVMRIVLVLLVSIMFPIFIYNLMEESILRISLVGMTSAVCIVASAYFVGSTTEEQIMVRRYVKSVIITR